MPAFPGLLTRNLIVKELNLSYYIGATKVNIIIHAEYFRVI